MYKMEIDRVRGAWKVVPKGGARKVAPGEDLEWKLVTPRGYSDVKAYFQFTDEDPRHGTRSCVTGLTKHWTAKITRPAPNNVFRSAIRNNACRRCGPRHYAVMVIGKDATGREFREWAIGKNPPPDVDVGP
jgi:hypothetical protein